MNETHRIPDLPPAGYYIPNFITAAEEQRLIAEINRLPKAKWTVLSHRRLLSLPSMLIGDAKDTLIAAPLPKVLEAPILDRFRSYGVFADSPHHAPNQCLVNEYEPGQGIMPHEDGPAYYPLTATVSLKGHTVLDIYKKTGQGEKETEPSWRILQEPRSLLITTADMYKDTLHGIAEATTDTDLRSDSILNWKLLADTRPFTCGSAERQIRVSLTYRDVLKVAKVGGALKFMSKR